jgi:hypothetical protein
VYCLMIFNPGVLCRCEMLGLDLNRRRRKFHVMRLSLFSNPGFHIFPTVARPTANICIMERIT